MEFHQNIKRLMGWRLAASIQVEWVNFK
jgi:hypothetical protein